MDRQPGDRYFGGPSNNLQYSVLPGSRGKTSGGNDTIGPNDPIFHPASTDSLTRLPSAAKPPGASFDPVTPLHSQPQGPNNDEFPAPGMH